MKESPETAIERVARMERLFDEVGAALDAGADVYSDAALFEALRTLDAYMDGGQWLRDYALDERGALPKTLKRGVLSEDGLYNLLTEAEERRKNA